jgi:CheY-like chemotaxis protein
VPQTLLLADDSVTIQRVIELTFADEDIQVVAVSDGDQAIAVLNSQPPDIVLADIGMPGKSGYEVAQHIRNTPSLAHIPVVLLTGAFEPVDQAKAAAAGCNGVLAKPFEPQLVIGRVRELLAQTVAAHAAPGPPPLPAPPPAVPFMDPHLEREQPPAPPASATGDYFDRLDQALSGFNSDTARPAPPPPAAAAIDWFSAPPPPDEAAAGIELRTAPSPAAGSPAAAPEQAPASSPRSGAAPLPALADAFAALLAAEQGGPPAVAPPWPPAPPPAAEVTEELVERVAARVLEQLSDRVVRETVTDIVSQVAERLVREEIARIKASIK